MPFELSLSENFPFVVKGPDIAGCPQTANATYLAFLYSCASSTSSIRRKIWGAYPLLTKSGVTCFSRNRLRFPDFFPDLFWFWPPGKIKVSGLP